jgi:hypothetical protein
MRSFEPRRQYAVIREKRRSIRRRRVTRFRASRSCRSDTAWQIYDGDFGSISFRKLITSVAMAVLIVRSRSGANNLHDSLAS